MAFATNVLGDAQKPVPWLMIIYESCPVDMTPVCVAHPEIKSTAIATNNLLISFPMLGIRRNVTPLHYMKYFHVEIYRIVAENFTARLFHCGREPYLLWKCDHSQAAVVLPRP